MKLNGQYRNKFLSALWLLKTQSNEDSPLSTQEIIAELKDRNVNIDRRTLKKEIDMMKEHGFNIAITKKGHQLAYYIPGDLFNFQDLNILISACRAASFITKEKTDNLVNKLINMGKDRGVDITDSELVCYNVIKQNSSDLFDNIITLQKSIDSKKQVSFLYFNLDENLKKVYKKSKKRYVVNPVSLVYNDSFYYLIAWNQNKNNFTIYRVDRCDDIIIEEADVDNQYAKEFLDQYLPVDKGVRKEAEFKDKIKIFAKQTVKMYGGVANHLSLKFPKELLGSVYDKFGTLDEEGKKYKISYDDNDKLCTMNVHVQTSPTLWVWIAGFGGRMKVIGPNRCKNEFREFCKKLIDGLD